MKNDTAPFVEVAPRNLEVMGSGTYGGSTPPRGPSESRIEERLAYFQKQEHHEVIAMNGRKVTHAQPCKSTGQFPPASSAARFTTSSPGFQDSFHVGQQGHSAATSTGVSGRRRSAPPCSESVGAAMLVNDVAPNHPANSAAHQNV